MKKKLFTIQGFSTLVLLMFVLLSTTSTVAQTMSGNGTKAWFGVTNWTSPSSQPATNGAVIINSSGTLTINMNAVTSITLASFTASGSGNITMNSSGTATITTGSLTINKSFDFSRPIILTGTGTVASSQTLACNANLTLNSGATLTVNGTLTNSQTITVKSGALLIFGSSSIPPGNVTVEAGGEVRFIGSGSVTGLGSSSISGKVSFQGTRAGASGFTPTYLNGSTLEYKGSSAQTANVYEMKSTGISNIIIDNTSGVTFADGGATPNPTINGTLTLTNGILNLNNNVTAKITFTGSNPIVRTNGTINASGTYATLIFNNVTGSFTLPNSLFNNTTITRLQVNMQATGTLTMNSQNVTVSQLLLTKGYLAVGSGNLTFGGLNTTFGSSTLNATSMVVTPNAGYLCYDYPVGVTSSVIFPLGETTGIAEYTPLTLGFAANSSLRTIGFKITDGTFASTGSVSDYLTRYYTMYASSTAGTYEYSLNTNYNGTTGDVVGNPALIQPAVYSSSSWNLYPGTINTISKQVEYTAATQVTGPVGNGYVYMGRFVSAVVNTTWYLDADNDGYYVATQIAESTPGTGWTSTEGMNGDCDDDDNTVWRTSSFYFDSDDDGYAVGGTQSVCYGATIPAHYVATSLGVDCNDNNNTVWRTSSFYFDSDDDGYAAGGTQSVCYGATIPAHYVATSLGVDCNDNNNTVWRTGSFYTDSDGDGYTVGATQPVCYGATIPTPYVATSLGVDCDDTNASIKPGATEICYNNIDDNCSTTLSEGCASVPVNMTPSYDNTTLTSLGTAIPAIPYTYAPYTDIKYRFSITNVTTGVTSADIITTSRFVTIPVSLHAYNATYSIKASAVINNEVVPYAGNTITVFSPVVTKITLAPTSCGATLASLTSTLTANAGLNAIEYTFRIRETGGAVYATSTSSSRFINANSFTGFPLSYSKSYQIAVQYTYADPLTFEQLSSGYGTECTVLTPGLPTTSLASPTCGSTVTTLSAGITASSAPYATSYQFRIRLTSNVGGPYIEAAPVPSRFSSLTGFGTLQYNSSYSVSVRYSIVNNSITSWSNYGPECVVNTPNLPTTQLVPSQCGQSAETTLTQQLNIVAYPGFPIYRVKLTEVVGEDLGASQEITVSYAYFRLNQFSTAQNGKVYNIEVAIKQGSVFGPYSTVCDIHTPEITKTVKMPFKAVAYPNPFANNFMLDVKTTSQSVVNLKVYDMVGRLIDQRDVSVSDLETTTIGDRYPSGIYNVVVSQEDSLETVRVVKR